MQEQIVDLKPTDVEVNVDLSAPNRARDIDPSAIVVVNLGGQYAHMIGRRLRDLGVRHVLVNDPELLAPEEEVRGYILSGGPQSVYDGSGPSVPEWIATQDKPVLGICYGHQLLAQMLGLRVEKSEAEFGPAELTVDTKSRLFKGVPTKTRVWMSHNDSVADISNEFSNSASTSRCKFASISNETKKKYGVQFHPEVDHSEHGNILLENFARDICAVQSVLSIEDEITIQLEKIREQANGRKVFFFVSGGVDSMVAFTLCARALGPKNVHAVYVDTGFMRENETDEVRSIFEEIGLSECLTVLEKGDDFFRALGNETDPERKRAIIGKKFIDIQAEELAHLDSSEWILGQGTIYPDTVESGGDTSSTAKIKTHHNRVDEVIEMIKSGQVIEPIRDFYKDEVRAIGLSLGLGHLIIGRWPFPGPGLAIRCLCSDVHDELPINENVSLTSVEKAVAKRFPVRSVGVQGDGRTYRDAIAITSRLSFHELEAVASEICNTNENFNRVIYHLAGADIGRGVFRRAVALDRSRVQLLQHADFIVRKHMLEHSAYDEVWQFPVVMVPVSSDGMGDSIVLRPVNSRDGMTANFARLKEALLSAIANEIAELDGIDAVYLDVSDKPPATIEWE
jgi:GMP synthase (glutamine-hydrolysing)